MDYNLITYGFLIFHKIQWLVTNTFNDFFLFSIAKFYATLIQKFSGLIKILASIKFSSCQFKFLILKKN